MLSYRIKTAIENHSELKYYLQKKYGSMAWQDFTRTQYGFIAERINRKVSEIVKNNIAYIKDRLIIGNDMFYSVCHSLKIKNEEEFITYLENSVKAYSWISGKALESYWKHSKPKEVKLNTLLVYLEIPASEWDDWKYAMPSKYISTSAKEESSVLRENQLFLQHYIGSYFLYCPKTDNSGKILKCPFVIKPKYGEIIAETITEGHRYLSSPITRQEGHIQIICKNLDWNETETHLLNIGLKTKPEIIFGVSITLSVNMGTPVALKNILVYQSPETDFLENIEETELSVSDPTITKFDKAAMAYFEKNACTIMMSEYSQKFDEFLQY